jgi:hypothetical protein
MIEESQIHGCGNEILDSFSENGMASIVAFMERLEDVVGVISDTVIVTICITNSCPGWR